MNLESTKTNVEKSAEYIFNALTDIKNFEKINARKHSEI